MIDMKRNLYSIGMNSFVTYFEDYERLCNMHEDLLKTEKHKLAKRLLEENPKANSFNAQIKRINSAIAIFENKLQYDALESVLASRQYMVTEQIKQKVRMLLNKRNGNTYLQI